MSSAECHLELVIINYTGFDYNHLLNNHLLSNKGRNWKMSPLRRHSYTIELALLGYLRKGPQHGYQIYQQLADPNGLWQVWRLKQSRLYALLARLEESGYIESSWQLQDTRPARRVYRLTSQGQAAFLDWLVTPVAMPRLVRQEFMVKLYFARQESAALYRTLVARQKEVCSRWLQEFEGAAPDKGVDGVTFSFLIHAYRLGHIRSILEWLELCN